VLWCIHFNLDVVYFLCPPFSLSTCHLLALLADDWQSWRCAVLHEIGFLFEIVMDSMLVSHVQCSLTFHCYALPVSNVSHVLFDVIYSITFRSGLRMPFYNSHHHCYSDFVLLWLHKLILFITVFFKEHVRYPVWTFRDPISLILATRFSLILGTQW